ncbi:protein GVQW3 [Bombina bombina]|uniref:protein GVQW3 n=1 Tax=Bombina bombina TaxID=8345 RepID=UPI00235AE29B|nr:protein GVQW3 [Bombina bombina]
MPLIHWFSSRSLGLPNRPGFQDYFGEYNHGSKTKKTVVIEFLTKEVYAPKEIHNRLKRCYGDAVVDIRNVRHWVKKFQEGETKIADKLSSGHPSTSARLITLQTHGGL